MSDRFIVQVHEIVKAELLRLQPGDVLHVKVGIENMGDGMPPWIPSPDELEYTQKTFEPLLPEGVKLVVTHMGVDTTAIRALRNASFED